MAGMHFIILKVNGVDVSQMPHEEAVQMFLNASEPILVEVRRRSYNGDSSAEGAECPERSLHSDEKSNQKKNINIKIQSPIRRQSPTTTTTQLPLPAKQYQKYDPLAAVDSLKFHSLIISSSQSPLGLESSSTKNKSGQQVNNNSGSLPITARNNNNSASVSFHYSSNNHIPYVDESSNQIIVQPRRTFVSSVTSPTKSLRVHSPLPTHSKEVRTSLPVENEAERVSSSKELISIGVQTDNFTTDFIFSGASMLNTEQIIENDHNLFSECIAPEIDIEEITLRKSESNERLGLTVSYSSGGGNGSGSDDTDTCTEVYISDIVPDSIAGRDGRLRQGDQILQVNGKDVSNKEETESLIAENNNAVTLLVSRYLYGDDDEFNEQGDFYDDDEPNMAYANCLLGNYIFSEDLSKSAKSSYNASPEKKTVPIEDLLQTEQAAVTISDIVPSSTETMMASTSNTSSSKDPLNHHNIRAHLEQVNQEIAILDSRVENMMLQHAKPTQKSSDATATSQAMQVMDYETEHIYETIPEDSESEPFYCSPYESSEHQTRVEQWLGMQDGSEINESKIRLLQQNEQHIQQNHDSLTMWGKAKNGTVRSTNSSAGDDHENSSSAYNTGGSCNSNTMAPLTLELNPNYRDREQHSTSTLILCSSRQTVSPINITSNTQQHRLPTMQGSAQEIFESAKLSSHRHSKEKLLSPTHSSKVSQNITNKPKVFCGPQKMSADIARINSPATPISVSNTMYTNVANLQQTMLLQQQLFRQALIHQRVPSNSVPCPQFTAPNLSQYHFVSSQEVSTVKLNTHSNEEHMVWKVKRRQDGTRYIVRRPARNRFLRNRALRINAERNDQTTEDDTISEIKTGRYWTKEDRKKHIERARERRQRQQIIITNKNNEISPSTNIMNAQTKNSDVTQKNSADKLLQMNSEINQPKLIQTLHTLSTASAAKIYRQHTPSGQNFSKKLVKKNTNNSPVEVIPSVSAIQSVIGTGTIKPPATSTPSAGNKMVGLLSVTTV